MEEGRKLREDGTELKNRCHQCGEPKRGHICRAKARGGPQVDIPIQLPQFHVGGGVDMGGGAIPMPMLQGPSCELRVVIGKVPMPWRSCQECTLILLQDKSLSKHNAYCLVP